MSEKTIGIGGRIIGVARQVKDSPVLKRQFDQTVSDAAVIAKLTAGRLVLNNVTNMAVKGLPFGMGGYITSNKLYEAMFKFTSAQFLALVAGVVAANLGEDNERVKYLHIAVDAATLASVDAIRDASGIEDMIMNNILTPEVLNKIKPLM